MGESVLMTLRMGDRKPGLEEAASHLGVALEALDQAFGVLPSPDEKGAYVVSVRASALSGGSRTPEAERFSDPPIAHFGPPKD